MLFYYSGLFPPWLSFTKTPKIEPRAKLKGGELLWSDGSYDRANDEQANDASIFFVFPCGLFKLYSTWPTKKRLRSLLPKRQAVIGHCHPQLSLVDSDDGYFVDHQTYVRRGGREGGGRREEGRREGRRKRDIVILSPPWLTPMMAITKHTW